MDKVLLVTFTFGFETRKDVAIDSTPKINDFNTNRRLTQLSGIQNLVVYIDTST